MLKRLLLKGLLLGLVAATVLSCGGEERATPLDPNDGKNVQTSNRRDASVTAAPGGDASAVDASLASLDAAAPDAGSSARPAEDAGPKNCGDIVCRGNGQCVQEGSFPICVCDYGYVSVEQDGEFECVVDKTCRKLRSLEGHCRYLINSAPAVAMFFAVDYCAGTAVLPEDLGDPEAAFQILEDGVDIQQNPESAATIIERDVESFVTIALDVSNSVADVENDPAKRAELQALVAQLRNFVQSLEAPSGEPPVSLSVMVFGRIVAEYVPYTTDLGAVDAALQALEQDPASVVSLVGGQGTALYPAVKQGIEAVERVQTLRDLVTRGGVLTTGTLVVVTDGNDTSGDDLDENQIRSTLVNVISIGISDDIDDDDLTTIGRDGSFLAPESSDWQQSFEEIAERVDQYPDRAYLLAYCSSAITGNPEVAVSLTGPTPDAIATCEFDADAFSREPDAACDLTFFEDACNSLECGGFLACGACANDRCCTQGSCQPPTPIAGDCLDQDQLCEPAGQMCAFNSELDVDECVAPLSVGEECDARDDNCEPGVAWCLEGEGSDPDVCAPVVLSEGAVCGDSDEHDGRVCSSLNCAQTNPDNSADFYLCQADARMFDRCSGNSADATCEQGTFCGSTTCEARSRFECTRDEQCLSGVCPPSRRCADVGTCYFTWNDKL